MLYFFIVLYTLLGYIVYEAARRNIQFFLTFFVAAPLLLTPYWIFSEETHDWFMWGKVYLCLSFIWLMIGARFLGKRSRRTAFFAFYFLLAANILEAAIRVWIVPDCTAALFNGISGILIIFTIPPIKTMSIASNKHSDFLWDTPYSWIWGYSFWNWILIYILFPYGAGFTISTLLVPLIVSFQDNRRYIQARAISLAFYLLAIFTFPEWAQIKTTENWENSGCQLLLATILLAFMTLHFFITYRNRLSKLWQK